MADEKPRPDIDPGHCGVGNLSTGDWDPYYQAGACPRHDAAFDAVAEGKRRDMGFGPLVLFLKDSSVVFARSAYGVVAFPFYVVLGGFGGLFRWHYLRKNAAVSVVPSSLLPAESAESTEK